LKKLIVISGYGVSIRARKGVFIIQRKGEKPAEISPAEVDSIVVTTQAVSISSAAIQLAAKMGIDLAFYDQWTPLARLIPATYGSTLKTWKRQIIASKKRRVDFAKAFVQGKVYNQRQVLYSLAKIKQNTTRQARARIREAIEDASTALQTLEKLETVDQVRSQEAHVAKTYWRAVSQVLPQQLGFKTRIKKYTLPPGEQPDPFNIALNIGYSLLLKETWRAIFNVGLNPFYGFLHAKRPGRMSLVLDLMEEFRPIAVDRPLIRLARKEPDTIRKAPEDKQQRSKIWKTVWTQLTETQKPLKNQIQTQARKLAKAILENKPYHPYTAPW